MGHEFAGPSLGTLRDALAAVSPPFAQMLRQVPDPTEPAIGAWSVGETAAHMASSAHYFLAVARGDTGPEALDQAAANNAAFLASDPERDPRVLADRFEAGEQALLAYIDGIQGDPRIELFRGIEAPLSTMLAVELAEVLVHGFDIARGSGLAWRIAPKHAALAMSGMAPLFPHMVDTDAAAGLTARFELRLRGAERMVLAVADGTLRVEAPSRQAVDCRLSVDPVAYLLLGYHRIGPLSPMLRGKLMAWGRRPWLAATFSNLFRSV